MLTYAGMGYSEEFIANFERVVGLIAADEPVYVVLGTDDICAPLLTDPKCHCRDSRVTERDRIAALALSELLQQPIHQDARVRLTPDTLRRMRKAFRAGTIREACRGCQWSQVCDAIARDDFRSSHLACIGVSDVKPAAQNSDPNTHL